jgi:hypothetical protein
MASVASFLLQARPTALGTVALIALAMTPHDHVVSTATRVVQTETMAMLEGRPTLPLVIDLPDLPVIRPATHHDARPYPRGMVIAPPPFHDPIVLWDGSPLDTLLSVLAAPFRAFDT